MARRSDVMNSWTVRPEPSQLVSKKVYKYDLTMLMEHARTGSLNSEKNGPSRTTLYGSTLLS